MQDLKGYLDELVLRYNRPEFIPEDPISIPHAFKKPQDIEIAGFWASILAWGNRTTIINKCRELFALMGGTPHDFVLNHSEQDLKALMKFKHRTFNDIDTLYFISFFKAHYQQHDSLETAFLQGFSPKDSTIENSLNGFYAYFFSSADAPQRTRKHIASPARKSACKRINMFLRWMVRHDHAGVDFGLWKGIQPRQLICPCDLHVERVARQLNLITRKPTDWRMALELTEQLRGFDAQDPVKYDFALFGLGIEQRHGKSF